jgi:hypothetical protein
MDDPHPPYLLIRRPRDAAGAEFEPPFRTIAFPLFELPPKMLGSIRGPPLIHQRLGSIHRNLVSVDRTRLKIPWE